MEYQKAVRLARMEMTQMSPYQFQKQANKAKKEELRRDPKLREQVKNACDQREFQTLAGKIVFRSLLRKYLSQ